MKVLTRLLAVFMLLTAPVFAQTQSAGMTASGTTCATTNACVTLPLYTSSASATIMLSGTFVATVQFEVSPDGGTTWFSVSGSPVSGGAAVSSATATGAWEFSVPALTTIRTRISAYTSGTVTATIIASSAAGSASAMSGVATNVNAAQSGNWSVRSQDGAGNALTSNSSTFTAKFGLDMNLLGTLGTAFSTAGKVDVKGADGDVFVRQTTAANLLTQPIYRNTAGTDDPCMNPNIQKSSAIISQAASTQELVATSASTVVYVCGGVLEVGGPTSPAAQFKTGTNGGTPCSAGAASLTGNFDGGASATPAIIPLGLGNGTVFKGSAGGEICLTGGGTTPSLKGWITYVQQ